MEQVIRQLGQQRKRLTEPSQLADSGRITAVVEVAVLSLYNRLTNPVNLDPREVRRHGAVVAFGEFGRRHLGPLSPLSLLFLQGPNSPLGDKDWLEAIALPLEQAGWQVNCQIASVEEAVTRAREELFWLQMLLDGRFISGSRPLMDHLRQQLGQESRQGCRWPSVQQLAADWRQRQRAQRDPDYLLEPDLDYSAGSLGELNRIRWSSALLYGMNGFQQLAATAPGVFADLGSAENFQLKVRNYLQLLRNASDTRLRYQDQEEVAARLGYQDRGDFLAVELLMSELERHFYRVNIAARHCFDLLTAWLEKPSAARSGETPLSPGMFVAAGRLDVDPEQLGSSNGQLALDLFRHAVRLQLPLGLQAQQWLRTKIADVQALAAQQETIREWLWEIIRGETSEVVALRGLYDSGVLAALCPELEAVHGLVQHDAFHLYPVHEHHLQTFAEAKRLLQGHYDQQYPQVQEWR
ncbi:MAG: hypothetical protein JRJ12_04445, partial [Deltaproteobacteria bacterium]|nr:hypothetical protein [Deltaproteobacteria bacterium]